MRIQVRVPYVTVAEGIARMARRLKGPAWVEAYLGDFDKLHDAKQGLRLKPPDADGQPPSGMTGQRSQRWTLFEYAQEAVEHLGSFLTMATPPGCHVDARIAVDETDQTSIEVVTDEEPYGGYILLFQGSPFEHPVDKLGFQSIVEWAWDAVWERRPWWKKAVAGLEALNEHTDPPLVPFEWESFDEHPWQPEDWEDWKRLHIAVGDDPKVDEDSPDVVDR